MPLLINEVENIYTLITVEETHFSEAMIRKLNIQIEAVSGTVKAGFKKLPCRAGGQRNKLVIAS